MAYEKRLNSQAAFVSSKMKFDQRARSSDGGSNRPKVSREAAQLQHDLYKLKDRTKHLKRLLTRKTGRIQGRYHLFKTHVAFLLKYFEKRQKKCTASFWKSLLMEI